MLKKLGTLYYSFSSQKRMTSAFPSMHPSLTHLCIHLLPMPKNNNYNTFELATCNCFIPNSKDTLVIAVKN